MVKSQEKLDRTFSALSDQTRRQILWQLRTGPQTVNELAAPYNITLAAVSKHLKVLENADLINRKREGRQFLISLRAKPLKEAQELLEFYRNFWESNLDRLAQYVEKSNPKGKRK